MTEDSSPKKTGGEQPGRAPNLVPPDATRREEQKPSRAPLLLVVGGLLLVTAALLVVFLPLLREEQTTAPLPEQQEARTTAPQPPAQNQDNSSQVALEEAKEIEQMVGTWLQKQAEAEAMNVSAWGGDIYSEASSTAKECDQLLMEEQYHSARAACAKAIGSLNDLMASKSRRLEEAVAAGLLALEQGKHELAVNHFQQALAIEADDKRAISGLHRSEQLPTVLRFLQEGQALEAVEDLEGASLAFTEAANLDPDFTPAQQALSRVKAAIAEKEFQQAMSLALQSMAKGNLSAARRALQKAEAIKPGDRAVRDLKQQVSQTQRSGRLAILREETVRLEKEERWAEALKACTEALALDSHAAFATSCKERASSRIDLDNQFKSIFAKPERLFEEAPRKKAHQTLLYASQVKPRGPALAAQIDQLDKLVTQAEAEIEVVILSDGQTDIVIYHVGRLGVFQEKSLVLRTGNYTATGSRNGFRDVRQTLKVRPGSGKMVFTLRCEEPI